MASLWSSTLIFTFEMVSTFAQLSGSGVAPEALQKTWKFFADGGFFMLLIVCCSVLALMVIVYKMITLTKSSVVPGRLAGDIEVIETHYENDHFERLRAEFREGDSSLARLCDVALRHDGRPVGESKEAVQASAREEIVRMNAGLPILDVVITVAPLLGLLGTASGLVLIFGNTEDLTSGANNAKIGAGIARALGTTIAGMVVAVPSVVAHSYFTRKIETMAARLEVLLGGLISSREMPARDRNMERVPELSQFPDSGRQ